jgi:DNA-binding PadR family transcriptional regulator
MRRQRRPSPQTAAVLLDLAEQGGWTHGYDLCGRLGLKAGTVYPILMRLADRGLLETAWETQAPAGRPPRHLYRLTGPGRVMAADLAAAAEAAPARAARGGGARRGRPRLEGG